MNYSYEDIFGGDFDFYDGSRIGSGGGDTDFSKGYRKFDDASSFFRGLFVLVLRAGFILVQTGSIPVENIYIIVFYNVIEIAVALISYGLLGFLFSFSSDKNTAGGVIGYPESAGIIGSHYTRAVGGFASVLIGTAQMSTFLVGRIHMGGALILIFLYSALYQPLLLHWIWHPEGWMSMTEEKTDSALIDHGGGIVVHIPSTLIGLVGSLFLGRRLVKVREMDELSISNDHVSSTTVGYLLIILGYMDFSLTTANSMPVITVNNLMALASGTTIVCFLYFICYKEVYKYWIIQRCIQGGIAGMMTASAGIDGEPWRIVIFATVGGILFFFLAIVLHNTALEDVCNMTSSHLICGTIGALLCPLLAPRVGGEKTGASNLLWQFIYTLVVLVCTTVFALIIFLCIKACKLLRNKYEVIDHQRALTVRKNLEHKGYLDRLFMIDDTKTPHIIPGSFRKRFYPETSRNPSDSKNVSYTQDPQSVEPRKRDTEVGPEDKMDEDAKLIIDGTNLMFPLSCPKPKTNWSGSGDYYDLFG